MSDRLQILVGDARERLKELPGQSIHCCVTSPPYFGLRDYGVDGQMGLEKTPETFVEGLVGVFREVRRVLRDDGTLWLNLGDSYNAAGRKGHGTRVGCKQNTNRASANGADTSRANDTSLKEKDLLGIPWRVAFALQADGWYLRQDIIWHKPNPMPESVKDRCTKAHEYLFLLSKSPRYYFDSAAMRENGSIAAGTKGAKGSATRAAVKGVNSRPPEYKVYSGFRNKRSVWSVSPQPYAEAHFATFPPDLIEPCVLAGCPVGGVVLDPFGGSGTTAGVALNHGRKAVLIELNPVYAELVPRRVTSIAGEGWDLL